MPPSPAQIQFRVRILHDCKIAIGPGKADLLEAIRAEGSISGAARAMEMSYRRAWQMVETMNACFEGVLVETSTGGAHGGGARLSDLGEAVLGHYRAIEEAALRTAQNEKAALISKLRKTK
ncbi:winged helix-turn-helix domain-containing protein [Pelagibacterium limicola]|uniref:winged helix-turn-helix domain-containing protein n=1 Tax=Pelagibacterium limicola TaxID=2791022 RepID=UPI0018AF9F40|nr:LysR family transcriptional regulator [Pelagibacterium limicola]